MRHAQSVRGGGGGNFGTSGGAGGDGGGGDGGNNHGTQDDPRGAGEDGVDGFGGGGGGKGATSDTKSSGRGGHGTILVRFESSRKITITDLKAPNDANAQVANATGVQVKLWIDKGDVGAPDVLVTDATITGGTMEVTFNSFEAVGDPVLGVAKWTVATDDYFFPIDTTVEAV